MKGWALVGLVLAAAIIVSMAGGISTEKAPAVDATAFAAGNPCVSDADCSGNRICCPISGTCTTVKGCRKDPL